MEIKTTMIYNYIPISMAKISKDIISNDSEYMDQLQNGTATWKTV